jgi:hypothetical protein
MPRHCLGRGRHTPVTRGSKRRCRNRSPPKHDRRPSCPILFWGRPRALLDPRHLGGSRSCRRVGRPCRLPERRGRQRATCQGPERPRERVTKGTHGGQDLGGRLLDWAGDQTYRSGARWLRLDAWTTNRPLSPRAKGASRNRAEIAAPDPGALADRRHGEQQHPRLRRAPAGGNGPHGPPPKAHEVRGAESPTFQEGTAAPLGSHSTEGQFMELFPRRSQDRARRVDQGLERRGPALQVDQDRRPNPRLNLPLLLTHLRTRSLGGPLKRSGAGPLSLRRQHCRQPLPSKAPAARRCGGLCTGGRGRFRTADICFVRTDLIFP